MNSGDVLPSPPPPAAPGPYGGVPAGPAFQRRSSKKVIWIVVSVVVAVLVLALLFVGAILLAVFSSIKSSTPYQHAVDVATHDSRVTAAMGAPVKPGALFTGNIRVNNDSGDADLSIPIQGPLHKGTLYVVARKSEGEWTYQKLSVRVEDSEERIDLLRPPADVLPKEK